MAIGKRAPKAKPKSISPYQARDRSALGLTASPIPAPTSRPPTTGESFHPIHYEVETKYGRLVCDFYLSAATTTNNQGDKVAAIVKAIEDRFADEPEPTSGTKGQMKTVTEDGTTDEERVSRTWQARLQASDAWAEFGNGLGKWLSNAMIQWFEVSILSARIRHGVRIPRDVGPGTVRAGSRLIGDLVLRQVEEWIKSPHISGTPLTRLPFYYHIDCLPQWKLAKELYNDNKRRHSWRSFVKLEHPQLPHDLIEWLAFSKGSTLGVEAFPGLPDDARDQLDKKLKDGYVLNGPSQIALEHASRRCGYPPYEYSIAHLKNSNAEHYELAVQCGLKSHLKNVGLPVPREKAKGKRRRTRT